MNKSAIPCRVLTYPLHSHWRVAVWFEDAPGHIDGKMELSPEASKEEAKDAVMDFLTLWPAAKKRKWAWEEGSSVMNGYFLTTERAR